MLKSGPFVINGIKVRRIGNRQLSLNPLASSQKFERGIMNVIIINNNLN